MSVVCVCVVCSACRVVSCVPISHGFDEHGPALLERDLAGGLGDVVHGPHVVAVHPHRRHAVARPPPGDAVARVLLLDRRRDRVAVVAAEEDRRRPQRRGKVQRRVEVALARRALAKIADAHIRAALRTTSE